MVSFQGRGFTSTVIQITTTAHGVQFRMDCDDHPDSWCQLTIPAAELKRLGEMVKERAGNPEDEDSGLIVVKAQDCENGDDGQN